MKIKKIANLTVLVSVFAWLSSCNAPKSDVIINTLTTENQAEPEGINGTQPHLSWIMESSTRGQKQNAYQVLVASSQDLLDQDKGDLWNSKKQKSDQSILVKYAGKELQSGMNCYWKVRIWDKDGHVSPWSSTAHWSMGLLKPGDWKAEWIGIDSTFAGEDATGQFRKLAARYLRKDFEVTRQVKKAVVYISGLGLYELHLNGQRTGNRVLAPGATDYTKTVFYNTYDVTSQLVPGHNAIGVILGNGRYFAMRKDEPFLMQNYGFPRLLMQLDIEYADGTHQIIPSDPSWKLTVKGPITENNEFDGEKYDARLEMPGWDRAGFDAVNWMDARPVKGPEGKLTGQINEPIRVTGHIKPLSVKQIKPGVYIYDMGQNMVGWVSLTATGKPGVKVTMRFAENLKPDGNLYLANIRSAKVTDTYIFNNDSVVNWQPRFTYHGFRYVELSGLASKPDLSTINGCVVNNDLASNGSFVCSDTMINRIYTNAMWGIRGNYRSFPTDCPQRDERMGWLGDRATGCRGESYIFNNGSLYQKWLGDMRDAQNAQGSIPDVCPAYWAMYNDNVTWDGTGIMVMDMLLNQYGNVPAIAENYNAMKKWVFYMVNKYGSNGLMPRDTYGDWCMPPENLDMIHSQDPSRITAGTLLGTSFFYHDLKLMQGFAKLLGKPDDETRFDTLSAKMKTAFNETFFVPSENYYGNNTVTANILSIAFGLVPKDKEEAVFNNAVKSIETQYHGHIPVGLIGIMYLQRILTDCGRADIAMRFATETTYPSWGYMVKNGATTIWELWNGNTANPAMNSGNHVMLLGDLIIWMHEYLAGIRPAEPGFKSLVMKPLVGEGVTFVKASHNSPYGRVVSEWKMDGNNNFSWDIQIPVNTTAHVFIPANDTSSVSESGKEASRAEGVTFVEFKDGFAAYEVLSGKYHFESSNVVIPKTDYARSATVSIMPEDQSTGHSILVSMSCPDQQAQIRYTLDGTEPGEMSPLYTKPVEVSGSCTVKARSFSKDIRPGYVTGRNYDIYNPGINGLNYAYFQGKWDSIPDYDQMKHLRTGKVNGFNLKSIKTIEDYWGVKFTGFIEIPRDGSYSFSTLSDDGSRLFINNTMVADNDGIHGPFSVKGTIDLKKGKYPVRLDYFEGNYGEMLRLEIEGPGIPRQSLPVSMLLYR